MRYREEAKRLFVMRQLLWKWDLLLFKHVRDRHKMNWIFTRLINFEISITQKQKDSHFFQAIVVSLLELEKKVSTHLKFAFFRKAIKSIWNSQMCTVPWCRFMGSALPKATEDEQKRSQAIDKILANARKENANIFKLLLLGRTFLEFNVFHWLSFRPRRFRKIDHTQTNEVSWKMYFRFEDSFL